MKHGHGDLEASLVLIFPVLLAYEIGVLFAGNVAGADVVTRAMYVALGSRTLYLLVHAAIAVLILLWERRGHRWGSLRMDVALPVRALAGAAFGAIFWYRSLAHAVFAQLLYDLVIAASLLCRGRGPCRR